MRLASLTLILLMLPALAGQMWHRDRPANPPAVADVIVAKYDRFPAACHEARILRLQPLIEDAAGEAQARLEAFDDCAAAHSALGQHDAAVLLLDRKLALAREVRDATPELGLLHLRRGLANKSRVLVRRWLSVGGADTTDLTDARTVIETWQAEDPFSTEARFAAREVAWLLTGVRWKGEGPMPNLLGIDADTMRQGKGAGALAREGFAGAIDLLGRRIVEGDWLATDYLYALSLALELEGRRDEAIGAWLRMEELCMQGRHLWTSSNNSTSRSLNATAWHLRDVADLEARRAAFAEARRAADSWVQRRNQHMLANLSNGGHPDTDPAFWQGWDNTPEATSTPPPDTQTKPEPEVSNMLVTAGIAALAVLLFTLAGVAIFFVRRHPAAPSVDEM